MSGLFSLIAPATSYACPDIDGLLDFNCDKKLEIIAFGDSITYGTGDPSGLGYPGRLNLLLPHAIIRNFGDPGENTPQGVPRAQMLFAMYPNADYAVNMEGVNDYWLFYSSANTKNNMVSIRNSAAATGAITMLSSLTAVKREFQKPWVASVNAQLSPIKNLDFFSLGEGIIGSDKLHPNAAGYQAMAQYLLNQLIALNEVYRPVDTDGDGMYDIGEAIYGSSPTNPDSDGDGLLDGLEVFTYNTGVLNPDTDGDGFSDGFEVNQLQSNPLSNKPKTPVIQSIEALPPT
ncbi:MAG: SGNH/GDSL hydrolase family protein [Bdellovibrionales bacterium]|nr:SGNH/GDSL hydrolase family protein [Bdellovibrionales bacterium]